MFVLIPLATVRVLFNVLSNFCQCARKSVVFQLHIFMPERLNFFHRCRPRQRRNQSHVTFTLCRSTYIQSLLSKPKSIDQRLDFHQKYITHMTFKITARQLETSARRFFAMCAAAQPRSLEGTLVLLPSRKALLPISTAD